MPMCNVLKREALLVHPTVTMRSISPSANPPPPHYPSHFLLQMFLNEFTNSNSRVPEEKHCKLHWVWVCADCQCYFISKLCSRSQAELYQTLVWLDVLLIVIFSEAVSQPRCLYFFGCHISTAIKKCCWQSAPFSISVWEPCYLLNGLLTTVEGNWQSLLAVFCALAGSHICKTLGKNIMKCFKDETCWNSKRKADFHCPGNQPWCKFYRLWRSWCRHQKEAVMTKVQIYSVISPSAIKFLSMWGVILI